MANRINLHVQAHFMELGLYTFADLDPEKAAGTAAGTHRRFQELIEEIELADQLGLDVFGIGEHHRPDYAVSAPPVVLAAAAVRTRQIKLSSAVTVLSSDDPVRVYQQFATVDQLSGGRAEIMVGRGSFIESFPLFGYDLDDYDALFEEKLDLLLQINKNERVHWTGKHRSELKGLGIYPRAFQERLPVWLAVGGTPASAVRAGSQALPLALAIIGGLPERFVPLIRLYRSAATNAGYDAAKLPVGINSHAYVADTSQQAAAEFFPSYAQMMNRIGRERGWTALNREQFDYMMSEKGSLVAGSPQQVIDKILYEHELFGHTRFLAQMSVGTLPHPQIMRSIELFGTRVAPVIRKSIVSKAGLPQEDRLNERVP